MSEIDISSIIIIDALYEKKHALIVHSYMV